MTEVRALQFTHRAYLIDIHERRAPKILWQRKQSLTSQHTNRKISWVTVNVTGGALLGFNLPNRIMIKQSRDARALGSTA